MNTAAVFAALSRAGIEPFPWCPVESELSPKQMHRLLQHLLTPPYANGYLAISESPGLNKLAQSLTELGVPKAQALVRRMVTGALPLDEEFDFLAAHMERVRARAEQLYRVATARSTNVRALRATDLEQHVYQLLELINESLDQSNLRKTTPQCVRTLAALEIGLRGKEDWRDRLPTPAVLTLLGAIALADAVTSLWRGHLSYGLPVGAVSLVLLLLAFCLKRRASKRKAFRAAARQDSMSLALPDTGPAVDLGRGNKAS